jgi:hypothetical protein
MSGTLQNNLHVTLEFKFVQCYLEIVRAIRRKNAGARFRNRYLLDTKSLELKIDVYVSN